MVIKGILESITNSTVNLVNADLLAKNRGLRIIESTVPAEGRSVILLPCASALCFCPMLLLSSCPFKAALNVLVMCKTVAWILCS